jgi:threonine/homoserine/homoserine lactone efflux protein
MATACGERRNVVCAHISPGPSFILVARTAVAVSRGVAIAAALGMASAPIRMVQDTDTI